MSEGPLLWYLNRAHRRRRCWCCSPLSVVLGVLSTGSRPGRRLPGLRHPGTCTATWRCSRSSRSWCTCVTAVVDSYVDIRWWQALRALRRDVRAALARPRRARPRPDRRGRGRPACCAPRLSHRAWRAVHQLAWAAWGHRRSRTRIGIGTDLATAGGPMTCGGGRRPRPAVAARCGASPPGCGAGARSAGTVVTASRAESVRMTRPAAVAGADPRRDPGAPRPGAARRHRARPSLAAHRQQYGELPRRRPSTRCTTWSTGSACGVAAARRFPFATKLEAVPHGGRAPGARGQPQRGRAGQQQGHRARADPPAPGAGRRGGDRPRPPGPGGARGAPRRAARGRRRDAQRRSRSAPTASASPLARRRRRGSSPARPGRWSSCCPGRPNLPVTVVAARGGLAATGAGPRC